MPRLRAIKPKKVKEIPTANPHSYSKIVEPIYEVHKVDRRELTELSCRATHQILARSSRVSENDNVYAIFLKYIKQDVTFLRNWLKVFMLANKKNFEIRAKKYLASKVLTFENWSDSISDGRKGDILVLYGLCMLLGKHAIVHLHNHHVWSTLSELGPTHAADLKRCEIHVCYLGRGLFMELTSRIHPLEIVADSANIQSIVIGQLTLTEELTYRKISQTGLGTGLDAKPRSTSTECKPSTSTDTQNEIEVSTLQKIAKVTVQRSNVTDIDGRFFVTEHFLSSLPFSKYRPIGYLQEISGATTHTETTLVDSDATIPYSSSDETIIYKFEDQTATTTKPKRRIFSMHVHGIKKRRKYYCYKCEVPNCLKSFKGIEEWNRHHRIHHKFKLKCAVCSRKFTTPSAHRAHRNFHAPYRYTCTHCNKKFSFQSGLKQHKTVHSRARLHRCFSGTCIKTFRWPQDLMRHIQHHLDKKLQCPSCDKTFAEKRLLKRHEKKHSDFYRYSCTQCAFKSKWPTPYKRHLKLHRKD